MTTSPLATPLPWNLVSAAYAAEIVPQFERYAADALRLADVGPGQVVADVACGPGTLSILAARAGARVIALDFAEAMVDQLRARVTSEAIEVVQGDGQALPWPDASADVGFSMFGLIFFPDRSAGLRELRRVVRPGGPVVIGSWHPMSEVPALTAVLEAIADATGMAGGGVPAPLATEADIREEFAAAGYTDVAIHTVTYAIEAHSAAEFFAALERTLAPLVLLRHFMGDAWPATRERIAASVVARLGDAPVRAPMPAFLTLAR